MTEEIVPGELPDTDAGPGQRAAALLVAGGGAVGTALRHALSEAISPVGDVPVGILTINLTGAALLGFVTEALVLREADAARQRILRLVIGTGLLGGYTTYSALATDAADLITEGQPALGMAYALATVVLGAAVTWAGVVLARTMAGRR